MAKQAIGIGTTANDGSGDPIRTGGDKINDNFNEIYSHLGGDTLPSTIKIVNRTPTNTGQSGDVAGLLTHDNTHLYICTGPYDGSTIIWKRISLSTF
jgi:hypothetical protein